MEYMLNYSIEVQMNLTVARKKGREEEERRKNEDLTWILPLSTLEARMDIIMEAMERCMEKLIVGPLPIGDQHSRGIQCIEQAQTAPEDLSKHVGPPLMLEKGEDKQLKHSPPPSTASHE